MSLKEMAFKYLVALVLMIFVSLIVRFTDYALQNGDTVFAWLFFTMCIVAVKIMIFGVK